MKHVVSGLALALALVTACSSSDSSTSSSSSGTSASSSGTSGTSGTTPAANAVTVSSNKFTPASISVKIGNTVTWTWAGGNHDVVSGANCTDDKVFTRSTLQSANGATFTHTFDKAGTFEYFCDPHCASAGMKGTVVVQ